MKVALISFIIIIYCVKAHKEYSTQIANYTRISQYTGGARINLVLKWFISFRSTNDSNSKFHKFIGEGRKVFKYVSVLAKGITKCYLRLWVPEVIKDNNFRYP